MVGFFVLLAGITQTNNDFYPFNLHKIKHIDKTVKILMWYENTLRPTPARSDRSLSASLARASYSVRQLSERRRAWSRRRRAGDARA